MTVGRALPGGTYAWFFPSGTRAAVVGRRNGDLRLRLSQAAEAWVPAAEARPLAPGDPAPVAVVGSVRIGSKPDRTTVRIPLSQPIPFRVEETDRSLVVTFYGALGDVDWMRYGAADTLVRRMSWRQAAADEVSLTFELAAAGVGLPRALGPERPAAGDPPSARDRCRRAAPRPAHRRGPGPSPRRRQRAHRSARSRCQPCRRARAAAAPAGGGRPRPHDAHGGQRGGALAAGARWPRRQVPTCWFRFTTTRCRTGSIRSSTTAPASTTTSREACRWRGRFRPSCCGGWDSGTSAWGVATWRSCAAPGCPRCSRRDYS